MGRLRSTAALAVGALVLTGCAVEADAPQASPTPDEGLAAKAEVAAKNKSTTSTVGKRRDQRPADRRTPPHKSDRTGDRDADASDGESETVTAGVPSSGDHAAGSDGGEAVDWDELANTGDGTGDHGNGPEYADITGLAIRDSGDDVMLRVTVAGVLPGQLVTGEVQGVGVDLYRSDDMESDYQVFFDGGTHGWRAFLQTPDGFVEFPGTFEVSGRTLTAVVPWASLGGRADASVSAFADWSSGVGRLSADGVPNTDVSVG